MKINPTNLTARRKWTQEEEAALCDIVNSYCPLPAYRPLEDSGPPWEEVAETLVSRTLNIRSPKACSCRFFKIYRGEYAETNTLWTKPQSGTFKGAGQMTQDQKLKEIADMFISWLREELEVK